MRWLSNCRQFLDGCVRWLENCGQFYDSIGGGYQTVDSFWTEECGGYQTVEVFGLQCAVVIKLWIVLGRSVRWLSICAQF